MKQQMISSLVSVVAIRFPALNDSTNPLHVNLVLFNRVEQHIEVAATVRVDFLSVDELHF
jgi:hypothetical protein